MPQLFHFLLCYNFMIITTYRNFCTSSFFITSWWLVHTATFPFPLLLSLHDDHYVPQLLHFVLCYIFMMINKYRNFSHFLLSYNFMMIITYRNFSTSSFFITLWWSLHPQLLHFLFCYNFMMIITYRNFFLSCFLMTSWWPLHTATFALPPLL